MSAAGEAQARRARRRAMPGVADKRSDIAHRRFAEATP